MHTLVFVAPSLFALASFAVWYVTRSPDLNAAALRIAEEETRTEFENERWAACLVHRAEVNARRDCNATLIGY